MSFEDVLRENKFILAEASIVESLRRLNRVELHPKLEHTLLIYDEIGNKELSHLYDDYISVAEKSGFPIIILTPTWRADKNRLSEAGITKDVNKDAAEFTKRIRSNWGVWENNIFIAGCIGCKNDCYKPSEALSVQDAHDFHSWQINKLAEASVDFLLAATIPALSEATGIAKAMSETGVPYVISFVINRKGQILDGASLEHAFRTIDSVCERPPIGYWINCSHPSFVRAGEQPEMVLSRFMGMQANASSCDQSDLDGAATLQIDDIPDWGRQMIELNMKYGVKILGGCCGTGTQHLQFIVDNIKV